jgi:uncharacterized protein YbaR (Trm112 family)
MKLEPWLQEILACPQCHSSLREAPAPEGAGEDVSGELVCTSDRCGLAYPIRDEIPVLLIDEARKPGNQRG